MIPARRPEHPGPVIRFPAVPRPDPDDPIAPAGAMPVPAAPAVIRAPAVILAPATGYAVYAVRLVVRDGEDEVESGVPLGRFAHTSMAEAACDMRVHRGPPPELPEATHVVVNDGRGLELYRRPFVARVA